MLTLILQRKIFTVLKNPTLLCSLVHFSSSSSAAQTLTPKSHLVTDYLIKSCGFTPQRVATVSKRIAGLKTFGKAESVRHFFKHHGYTDANIRSIISSCPRIIGADVDHTLQPNLHAIGQMGFSEIELRRLIIQNPQAILNSSSIARIEFWKTFLNNDMKRLALALRRNRNLLNHDTDTSVAPRIAFLKGYGLSEADIRRLLVGAMGFFGKSIVSMEAALKRVEELGIPCGSSMFVYGLTALHSFVDDTLESKIKSFMSYGWSEREFVAAVRRCPAILAYSLVNIEEKMGFLVGKVGCNQSYIVSRPTLLTYSLEKRLIPRFHVMNILRSSASMYKEPGLDTIMAFTEKDFLKRFIFRYMDQVPTLHDTYIAACSGKIQL